MQEGSCAAMVARCQNVFLRKLLMSSERLFLGSHTLRVLCVFSFVSDIPSRSTPANGVRFASGLLNAHSDGVQFPVLSKIKRIFCLVPEWIQEKRNVHI